MPRGLIFCWSYFHYLYLWRPPYRSFILHVQPVISWLLPNDCGFDLGLGLLYHLGFASKYLQRNIKITLHANNVNNFMNDSHSLPSLLWT